MGKFFKAIAIIMMISAINYLYRLQLGAIPFLLLAIFFFILAFQQLFSQKRSTRKKKKDEII